MTAVYLEVGTRRTFASAADWPGWCRAGKTEEAALEALAEAAPRYRAVAERARIRLPAAVARAFEVVERLPGDASTDFGAPGAIAEGERGPLTEAAAERLAVLLEASWAFLDDVVGMAPPALRKGPRGGGRDRDAVAQHVLAAEASYARRIGVKVKEPVVGDAVAIESARAQVAAAMRAARRPVAVGERGWPARYAARRIAWHVLDHAWEIEDKSDPSG